MARRKPEGAKPFGSMRRAKKQHCFLPLEPVLCPAPRAVECSVYENNDPSVVVFDNNFVSRRLGTQPLEALKAALHGHLPRPDLKRERTPKRAAARQEQRKHLSNRNTRLIFGEG
jgi:hypothetical protein